MADRVCPASRQPQRCFVYRQFPLRVLRSGVRTTSRVSGAFLIPVENSSSSSPLFLSTTTTLPPQPLDYPWPYYHPTFHPCSTRMTIPLSSVLMICSPSTVPRLPYLISLPILVLVFFVLIRLIPWLPDSSLRRHSYNNRSPTPPMVSRYLGGEFIP